jgi:hypothetical protein
MEKQAAELKALAASSGSSEETSEQQPTSPQTSLEDMSIQMTMDKNKESKSSVLAGIISSRSM